VEHQLHIKFQAIKKNEANCWYKEKNIVYLSRNNLKIK